MRQFNGSDYDTLFPRTIPSQVSGLYDSVYTKDQVNNLFNQCLLLDGSRAMTGNLNMNNHYIPNVLTGSSGADAARKDYVDNLIASCAKIQTGSYVGTGTYGPSNPVTLTFGFTPKFVVVSDSSNGGAQNPYADRSSTWRPAFFSSNYMIFWWPGVSKIFFGWAGFDPGNAYVNFAQNGTSISFYGKTNTTTPIVLNTSNVSYTYIGIG